MTPYFTPQTLPLLEASAASWVGTPWRANSRVRGVGASCHFAVAGVLQDAGFSTSAVPDGSPGWSRHQADSLMERWLDGLPQLYAPVPVEETQPGDIVGFRVGQCIHHLGILLPGGRFFQCIHPHGAMIASTAERLYRERVQRAWRPMA